MNKIIGILMLGTLLVNANEIIELKADNATIDEKTGVSIYTGNVLVAQGILTLGAQEVTLFTTQQKVDKIVATGNAYYEQEPSKHNKKIDASAAKIVFLPKKQWVYLTGNVKLLQGSDLMTGETLDYDIANDNVKFNQLKQSKDRVKFKFKM